MIQQKSLGAEGIKFYIEEQGREAARAYLYFLKDDIFPEPIGFIREIYIDKSDAGRLLVQEMIKEARQRKCYKIICTIRHNSDMQNFLKKSKFKGFGLEFRLDLF